MCTRRLDSICHRSSTHSHNTRHSTLQLPYTIHQGITPTMHISVVTSNIILATAVFCGVAAAMPAPQVVPLSTSWGDGLCKYAGQFLCVSDTVFAICDTSLIGIHQYLATGDTRCQGKGEETEQPAQSSGGGKLSATSRTHAGPHGSTHAGQPAY